MVLKRQTQIQMVNQCRCIFGSNFASLFDAIDRDGSGTIDQGELLRALRRLDIGLREPDVAAFLDAVDTDNSVSKGRMLQRIC